MKVRASEIAQFHSYCRRAYYYNNVRGWKVPSLGHEAEVGSMFHKYMEYFIGGENPRLGVGDYVQAHARPDLLTQEQIDLACDMGDFYTSYYNPLNEINRVLLKEQEVVLQVGEHEIVTHMDLVFLHHDGRVVVRDYKTKSSIPSNYSWFDLDIQMMVYYLAARQQFAGTIVAQHDIIRREVPPGFGHRLLRLNKDGSVAKNNASQDPEDYLKRVTFIKDDATLDAWACEVGNLVMEMEEAALSGSYSRSPSDLCNRCPYLQPCIQERDGETVNEYLASLAFHVND